MLAAPISNLPRYSPYKLEQTAAMLLLHAGLAASIPDAGGALHRCHEKSDSSLRIIDDATTTCKPSVRRAEPHAPSVTRRTPTASLQSLVGPNVALRSTLLTQQIAIWTAHRGWIPQLVCFLKPELPKSRQPAGWFVSNRLKCFAIVWHERCELWRETLIVDKAFEVSNE